jgi:biopolymer transport protein ExbD
LNASRTAWAIARDIYIESPLAHPSVVIRSAKMSISIETAGGKRKPVDAELNLIPFIDLLVCCVCFLLITAVWIQLARIDATAGGPSGRAGRPPLNPPPAPVTVLVEEAGHTVLAGRERLAIPRQGALYDFEALRQRLNELRRHHDISDKITITAADGIPYRQLVRTIDTALIARFAHIRVSDAAAKLGG